MICRGADEEEDEKESNGHTSGREYKMSVIEINAF
jgi:hypothetical protein